MIRPTKFGPERCLDGEWHSFNLRLGEIRELEELCKAGVFVVMSRLYAEPVPSGPFADVRETIRLGLIGGGTPASEAWRLVTRYVDAAPKTEWVWLAKVIMGAVAYGAPEKTEAEETENPPEAATVESTSPPSMEAAPSSVFHQGKSTASSSGNGLPLSKDGTPHKAASRKQRRRALKSTGTELQG